MHDSCWHSMALGFLLVVLVLTACQPIAQSTPVPSPAAGNITLDDVTGIWWTGSSYAQFYEDGVFRIANSVNLLDSLPAGKGQFQLDGNVLTLITDKESAVCAGLIGHYLVQLTEQGELQFELQDDYCNSRHYDFTNAPWSQDLP